MNSPALQGDGQDQEMQDLVPMPDDPDVVPGRYASIDVSPEPIFGPDQLGELKGAVTDLMESATRADSSARIWEVLQAWEARLFSRGFHFFTNTRRGVALNGTREGGSASEVMARGNAQKLFPVNVYGAREDKITAALSREVPGLKWTPKNPDWTPDQTMADAAEDYQQIWLMDSDIKGVLGKLFRHFYTDGRCVLWTRSVADQQRWGTETAQSDATFDDQEATGVTPETEMQPEPAGGGQSETPAVRELTTAHGVLESKVPIAADSIFDMGFVRLLFEHDVDILKERYPWIEDKIEPGSSVAGSSDHMDRMARIHVRLLMAESAGSGESSTNNATETHTWFRPSKYRSIKDKEQRALFTRNFPKGLRVTYAGTELAFIRNECMDDHIEIRHPKDGDGQNRRAIGTNYLPLQKILNQNIALVVKYFTACVPRRFASAEQFDDGALMGQSNDPGVITPVKLSPGQTIDQVTGIEHVPQPTTGLMEFVEWLINGAPEAMDGATPTIFGDGDTGTVGEATLNRDQALQVFSAPWSQACMGLAKCAMQAVRAAAANRKTNISGRTPGQGRLIVELQNLQGDALCYPPSLELPQTLAEQEAKTAQLIAESANVELYKAIVSDPSNLQYFAGLPALKGLQLPGLDAVEKQQGEFELLLESGPLDNPELMQLQAAIAKIAQMLRDGQTHPDAATPAGQQLMQQLSQQLPQLQQQAAALPPQVSSVPVAQDGSENHVIEAAIVLAKLNSPEGRKLKNGDEEQQTRFANLKLHWQEHEAMVKKLTPVQPLPVKATATVAIDKLPPNVQAQALQAMGVAATPDDFTTPQELVPHEVVVEKEGVDANGVPVKQKISTVNPGGKLS